MSSNPNASVMSVLLKSSTMNDAQTLISAMLAIQTQLSEIQENQRIIMKTLRRLGIEHRSRLSDLKKSTQVLLKTSHSALRDQLNEIQDSVDEQNDDLDLDGLNGDFDLFK